MPRFLSALALILLLVVGLGVLTWYLAYAAGPRLDGDVRVRGLSAPVTIGYDDNGVAVIEAASEADLYTGLGYAHAVENGWAMTLWRQVATGGLSRWDADSTSFLLDQHALALGFGALARASYRALPDDERALLDAYARGVNRAFEYGRLDRGDAFAVSDVSPDPWRPWDALAVERLVAYLATPPVTADSTARAAYAASPVLRRFAASDSLLRATLGIDGLGQSIAFTRRDGAGTALVQRHVYGRSALPLLQPVVLRQGGRSTLVASVPGTFVTPAGYGERAWSLFLAGPAALTPAADSITLAPTYDRIVTDDGDERLISVYRDAESLLLYDPNATATAAPVLVRDSLGVVVDTLAAPSSTWRLVWPGFRVGTDFGAWRALQRGEAAAFALVGGSGLAVDGGGVRVLGTPAVTRRMPGGVFAGSSPLTRHVADRVAVLADSGRVSVSVSGAALLADAYSAWAATLAPPLIASLGGPDEVSDDLTDAAAFLRGWDFRYDPASIGASIFERWMAVHRTRTGTLPDPAVIAAPPPPPDSTGRVPTVPAVAVLKESLRQALADLRTTYGPDGATWRWENVQRATRIYPLSSADTTGTSRFAPVPLPDGGHPTAIAWGPSLLFTDAKATASWSSWATEPGWNTVWVRHRSLPGGRSSSLRRPLLDPVEPVALERSAVPEQRIRLIPASD